MKDGQSVTAKRSGRRSRPTPPPASAIAEAHGREVECWACGALDHLEKAHIVPWVLNPRNDPHAYALLCEECNERSPDTGTADVFWKWLAVERGEAHSEPLPEVDAAAFRRWEEDGDFATLSAMAVVLGNRELGGTVAHSLTGVSVATVEAGVRSALILLSKWKQDGSVDMRIAHPEWFLSTAEAKVFHKVRHALVRKTRLSPPPLALDGSLSSSEALNESH